MKIFTIFARGTITACRNRRLVFFLWLANFILALLTVAPLLFLIRQDVAHSVTADTLLQRLDPGWVSEFFYRFADLLPVLTPVLLLVLLLNLLLAIFLNGGIIGRLNASTNNPTLADFLHDASRNFARFFRLFLYSIPIYLVTVGIIFTLLASLLRIFTRRAASEWPLIITGNLRWLLLILLLSLVTMFLDYVKIGLVAKNEKRVRRELLSAGRFLLRRFASAWGLYLLTGLLYLVLTLAYLEVARLLPKTRLWLVLIFFIWQQLFVAAKFWNKLVFYSGEFDLARRLRQIP